MKYKKGDRVKFIDEVGEGVVIAVKGDQVFVRDEHGFEIEMRASQLIACRPDRELIQREDHGDIESKLRIETPNSFDTAESNLSKKLKKNSKAKKDFLEIDLHIHELIEHSANLSSFEIVTIQLNHFKKSLDTARQKHYRRVIFIHGVGEGVLRSEIRMLLKSLPNCRYVDADYKRYGQGATEVNLWYN